jgi:succinate dehydrogenase / fumarate reductase flavoprotein subunit
VSVHGANRLGTNSLVDLVVFGRRAGKHIARFVKSADIGATASDAAEPSRQLLALLMDGKKGPHPSVIREEMEVVMMEKVGIFRNAADMEKAVAKMSELRQRWTEIRTGDGGTKFNKDVLGILELENLLDLAFVTAATARERTESRGAHARDDFPDRDDHQWLKHSMAWLEGPGVRLGSREVDITTWKPKPRVY